MCIQTTTLQSKQIKLCNVKLKFENACTGLSIPFSAAMKNTCHTLPPANDVMFN